MSLLNRLNSRKVPPETPAEQVNKSDPIRSRMIPAEAMEFLRAAALTRVNLVVAGDAGTGKTTLIAALVAWLAERPEPEKANVTINAGMLSLIRLGVPYLAELTVPTGSDSLPHLYTLMLAAAPAMTQAEFYELLNLTPTLLIELQRLKDGRPRVMLVGELQPDGTLKTIFEFKYAGEIDGKSVGRLDLVVPYKGMRVMEHMEAGGIILPNYFSFGGGRDK